jgi:hypothetical protein
MRSLFSISGKEATSLLEANHVILGSYNYIEKLQLLSSLALSPESDARVGLHLQNGVSRLPQRLPMIV